MMDAPLIPISGQSFVSKQDWINRATTVLTSHPDYRNTEHEGASTGWRGPHFTALCFDQRGRRVRIGSDFQRAEDDDAYPIWWVWPDQISPAFAEIARLRALLAGAVSREAAAKLVDQSCEDCDGAGWLWRQEIDPDGYHEMRMRGGSDDTRYSCVGEPHKIAAAIRALPTLAQPEGDGNG